MAFMDVAYTRPCWTPDADVSGATVHLVDAEYDTGPILLQRCVPVEETPTPRNPLPLAC